MYRTKLAISVIIIIIKQNANLTVYSQGYSMFQSFAKILLANVHSGVVMGHIENDEAEVTWNTSVDGEVFFVVIENVPC